MLISHLLVEIIIEICEWINESINLRPQVNLHSDLLRCSFLFFFLFSFSPLIYFCFVFENHFYLLKKIFFFFDICSMQ